jgi:hypothetical protein
VDALKYVCYLKETSKKKPVNVADIKPVRKYLSNKAEGFKKREEILKEFDSRAYFIEKKKGQLRSWCDSVVDVAELHPLRDMI